MLLANLDQVDAEFLAKVCEDRWPESDTLDFKRDLPGRSEQDKSELLKDVSAFANADGGDLVYGIEEAGGVATNVAPITTDSADAVQRRVLQVVDAGIEPRISGLQTKVVPFDGGYVLIVRVPASFQGPHCVRQQNNARRFVVRNGTTTTDLSMDQLRSAFDRSATLTERAEHFIEDRLNPLKLNQPLMAMAHKPMMVIHVVPLSGLAGVRAADLHAVRRNFTPFLASTWSGGNATFNLDGLLIAPTPSNALHDGYTQIYRNGCMSAVTATGDQDRRVPQGPVLSFVIEPSSFYRALTLAFIAALNRMGFAGPAVVNYSLLHIRGYMLMPPRGRRVRGIPPADRAHFVLPSAWIPDIADADVDAVARPLLDTLWQAFGVDKCWNYNEAGAFEPLRY